MQKQENRPVFLFLHQNHDFDKKALSNIVIKCFKELGPKVTAELVDNIKKLGFRYAEYSGITFSMKDIIVPKEKDEIITESETILEEVDKQYRRGFAQNPSLTQM